ncbi:MAG: protein translocase subunit SecD [Pseudomonadota bacterium]|nr:protein translocase subunit SecD [Pseudomonadota bacterium]
MARDGGKWRRPPADAPAMMTLGTPGRREAAPLNAYPFWKYFFVLLVIVAGLVYAAPNLYPPDYAVQISSRTEGVVADERVLGVALDAVRQADIDVLASDLDDGTATIRFPSNEVQIEARERIFRALVEAERADDFVVALNLASTTPEWLVDIGASRMSYGLDLSGGVHFLLEVDMERAVADRLEGFAGEMRAVFREDRLRYVRPIAVDEARQRISVRFRDAETRDAARTLLLDRIVEFDMVTEDVDAQPGLVLTLRADVVTQIEDYAITQNLQSLRNRVNELGVSEPLVQRLGRDRIVLDLPGIQDSTRAKEIIGKVANLEFRLESRSDALRSEVEAFDYQGRSVDLERDIIVTGDRVSNAQIGFDPETQLPQVNISLDGQGGSAMNKATAPSVGRRMGIVFKETRTRTRIIERDGVEVLEPIPYEVERVISLATIQSPLGSRFRITGLSQREASDLSLLLRAGALAAPMYIVEERTVGASLGEENIEAGFTSVAVGFALVMVFMLIYYRLFGLAANLALAANLVLIVAVMSMLGATLTLPGIAGIVLTVGMAVDANVLIFARIREELATRPPQQAIDSGFDRAFVTILDANITTFLVAIILYAIGSGPVKGFAVTLAIGIVTSMFTAIMGTRALVNLIYGGRNVSRLAI